MSDFERASRSYLAKHIFRRLLGRRETVDYPFGVLRLDPAYRGKVQVDITRCIGCGRCSRECPSAAIVVKRKRDGSVRIAVLHDQCANCGLCEAVCDDGAIALHADFTEGAADRASLHEEWRKGEWDDE